MTANELRELADWLSQVRYNGKEQAAYLRACADAMEKGPVAWRYWNEKSRSWNETSSASVAAAMQEGGRSVEPLYPIAMPALRLPEPMTDAEMMRMIVDEYGANCDIDFHIGLARRVKAEVIKRIKEANE